MKEKPEEENYFSKIEKETDELEDLGKRMSSDDPEDSLNAAITLLERFGDRGSHKKKPSQERIDTIQERIHLFEKMTADKANAHDLVRLSYLMKMIDSSQYADYLKIEKDCEE